MPTWLSQLLGLGSLTASNFTRSEPGYVSEARNYLRSPVGARFTNIINDPSITGQFEPFLKQRETNTLNDVQQRVAAGTPQSITGIGGPEVANLVDTATQTLIPENQAFIGNLGLNLLGNETGAETSVLKSGTEDTRSQSLADLARALLAGGGLGGSSSGTGTGNGLWNLLGKGVSKGVGTIWDKIFPNAGAQIGANLGIPGLDAVSGGIGALTAPLWSQLFGAGGAGTGATEAIAPLSAAENPATIDALTAALGGGGAVAGTASGSSALAPLAAAENPATVSSLTSALGGSPATAGGGFSMAGLAGVLADAGAGFFSGQAIGGLLPGQGLASAAAGGAGGAAAGALTGAVMGSFMDGPGAAIGAAIGALVGIAGGLFGSSGAAKAEKAKNLIADQAAQNNNISKTSTFWTGALAEAGYSNLDGWGAFVKDQVSKNANGPGQFSFDGISGNMDQPDAVAYTGSQLLLKQIKSKNPNFTSLDQIPGFRQGYIDYIMQNYKIEKEGNVVPVQNIGQAGGLVTDAGLGDPTGKSTLPAPAPIPSSPSGSVVGSFAPYIPFNASQFSSGTTNQFTGAPEMDIQKALSWLSSQGVPVPGNVSQTLLNDQQSGRTPQILNEMYMAFKEGRASNLSQFGL